MKKEDVLIMIENLKQDLSPETLAEMKKVYEETKKVWKRVTFKKNSNNALPFFIKEESNNETFPGIYPSI